MNAIHQMALVAPGTIEPGATRTFDYTFIYEETGAHPAFSCYFPGHTENLNVTVLQ